MTPFARFLMPATQSPQLWRLLVGCVIILVVATGGAVLIGMLPFFIWPEERAGEIIDHMLTGSTPLGMFLILSSFVFMALGVWLACVTLHKRGWASLFGPWRGVRQGFVYGAVISGAVLLALSLIWSLFFDGVPKTPVATVLVLLLLAIPLVAMQTLAEELVFRAYLPQQLAARFNHPLIWFVLPQVLFGLLHYDPNVLGKWAWIYVGIITLNGLVWMDLVRITGNIGVAWGWHFANNLFVMTILGPPDSFSGFQWMSTPYSTADAPGLLVLADGVIVMGVWFVLRRLLLRPATTT